MVKIVSSALKEKDKLLNNNNFQSYSKAMLVAIKDVETLQLWMDKFHKQLKDLHKAIDDNQKKQHQTLISSLKPRKKKHFVSKTVIFQKHNFSTMLNYSESNDFRSQVVEDQWYHKENVDLPLLNDLVNDSSDLGPESVLKDCKYNPLLNPFDMEWVFGFDISIPVLSLTAGDRREIFYSATNVGIVYNYCTKTMVHLRGHQSKIVSVSVDRSCRWLATADNGKDNIIMVWDTLNRSVVWTIFNHPAEGHDLILIGLSPSARLLITITNEHENTINFWLWTYGRDKPDETYTDDRSLGAAKAIEFHPDLEEHFMIVFEKGVIFFQWDFEQDKLVKNVSPKSPLSTRIGYYTDATYVNCCHECFVSTSKGCILVFGNTIFAKNYAGQEDLDNDKIFVKTIKIEKSALNCLTSVDEMIVTGDSNGTIMFFDKRIKLLYWYSRSIEKSIRSMSFVQNPRRKYIFDESQIRDLEERSFEGIPDCIQDRSHEYEILMKQKVPKDATLNNRPFITRDFFISTVDGQIHMMNYSRQEFISLFPTGESSVAAIDVHDEKPFVIVAYTKGHLIIFNYETHEEVVSSNLPETEPETTITSIKYSPQSLHLACGRSNGELWLLQPATLGQIYVEPFRFSNDKVMKIAFSQNSLQMAYYDSNNTIFGFYYDCESEDWIFKGKVRSHYKDVCNILFLDEEPFGLYTIGKDRHLIRYTNIAAEYLIYLGQGPTFLSEEELDISTRDRIEQKDTPIYFTPYIRKKFSKCGYFLIADDKHKYKTVNAKTMMCTAVYLGPAYGCFKDSPVCKMEFLPKSNRKYLIFMTKKQIGIQLMSIDGNPFKFVGSLGHPDELLDFQMCKDGKYVFTIGKNDRSVFMWRVKTASVETMHILGGVELQPYYCLIEGGRAGFLYQEMRDLFYYMQILQQGEQICAPRVVSNCINLGELPDLMRACGYYPSEYEIENLLTDMRYKEYDENGMLKDKVTFCEFVKLFINHKPAYGYTIESLEESFETITTFSDEYGASDMSREDFIEAITTTGEQVSNEQIFRCLITLLHETETPDQFGERDFSFMPDTIDFDYLTEDILGIDMDQIERLEKDDDNDDDDRGGYYDFFYRS
ncbi:WD repeat-containing protein 66-like Protein [Tribolium castaneum]|uniref:Cilia- and flagella-associated protein 251 n=1 Tax=Tribolium castaneum TaxID=7070 RepID=A0A139WCL9_TRICA|nr:WD repeat-containing protein 66-like Protein [Tribolium castaneum]